MGRHRLRTMKGPGSAPTSVERRRPPVSGTRDCQSLQFSDRSTLESRCPLGELEQVVLFAVVRLGGETHGAPVVEEIEERTGRRVSPGALYTVLGRLESKGFVESWIGDTVPDRGGAAAKGV